MVQRAKSSTFFFLLCIMKSKLLNGPLFEWKTNSFLPFENGYRVCGNENKKKICERTVWTSSNLKADNGYDLQRLFGFSGKNMVFGTSEWKTERNQLPKLFMVGRMELNATNASDVLRLQMRKETLLCSMSVCFCKQDIFDLICSIQH